MSQITFNAEIVIRLSDPTLVVIKPKDLHMILYARDPVNLSVLMKEIVKKLCKSSASNVTETK